MLSHTKKRKVAIGFSCHIEESVAMGFCSFYERNVAMHFFPHCKESVCSLQRKRIDARGA